MGGKTLMKINRIDLHACLATIKRSKMDANISATGRSIEYAAEGTPFLDGDGRTDLCCFCLTGIRDAVG